MGGNPINNIETVKLRFWAKVQQSGETVFGMGQPCWTWRGAHDDKGRPRFKMQGRSMSANRARFVLEGWEIGPKEHVVMFCTNIRCVNPDHHVLGTPKEAMAFQSQDLHPTTQLALRNAFMARKLKLETVMDVYELSAPVAKAMLSEDPQPIKTVVHPSA